MLEWINETNKRRERKKNHTKLHLFFPSVLQNIIIIKINVHKRQNKKVFMSYQSLCPLTLFCLNFILAVCLRYFNVYLCLCRLLDILFLFFFHKRDRNEKRSGKLLLKLSTLSAFCVLMTSFPLKVTQNL